MYLVQYKGCCEYKKKKNMDFLNSNKSLLQNNIFTSQFSGDGVNIVGLPKRVKEQLNIKQKMLARAKIFQTRF